MKKTKQSHAANGITDTLLSWYDACGRQLLWRQDRTLYKVWVSEIMLQQTRVEAVEPYYRRFLARFPDMAALSAAPEEEVLHAWQGLGYYSRARNLQKGVREVMEQYGGELPASRQEVEDISGIGSYTAGALLSIVHGLPEPAVDANVLRVFSRLFCLKQPITSAESRRTISSLVRSTIPADRPGDFNQAIMDLGAAICCRIPRCNLCPLAAECAAYQEGCQALLPLKAKKPEPKPVSMLVGVLGDGNRFFVRKRPPKGLLAGMWEFPTIEAGCGEAEQSVSTLFASCAQVVDSLVSWAQLRHVFSHRTWEMRIYRAVGRGSDSLRREDGCWMTLAELGNIPLGNPHRTIANWLAASTA